MSKPCTKAARKWKMNKTTVGFFDPLPNVLYRSLNPMQALSPLRSSSFPSSDHLLWALEAGLNRVSQDILWNIDQAEKWRKGWRVRWSPINRAVNLWIKAISNSLGLTLPDRHWKTPLSLEATSHFQVYSYRPLWRLLLKSCQRLRAAFSQSSLLPWKGDRSESKDIQSILFLDHVGSELDQANKQTSELLVKDHQTLNWMIRHAAQEDQKVLPNWFRSFLRPIKVWHFQGTHATQYPA